MKHNQRPDPCQALRDKLTGALIGLAHAADGHGALTPNTWNVLVEGLYLTSSACSPAPRSWRR